METPAPNPSDSEDVTTALETAQIFAAKGDSTEVAHWLARAAECAARDGNQARASEISTAAAKLSEPAAARRLPTPPPLPVASRPPAPSERAAPAATAEAQPMPLVRPASHPAAAPATAPSRPSQTPAPPSTRSAPAAALASKASVPAPVKEHHEESAVRESSPTSPPPRAPSERASRPPAHTETYRPFRLHGARVSITPSAGTNRFYVLKVLDDGEAVPSDGHEAFLVLADPSTKLAR